MKRLVNFFKNDRLWQILVALFFAVVLFFTAWSGNSQNKSNSSSASNTFTQTVESVPVDIKYDSDKYFISGYSYDAEVYLTATTQLALTTETSSDTRHFKLVADLSNLGQGTSRGSPRQGTRARGGRAQSPRRQARGRTLEADDHRQH